MEEIDPQEEENYFCMLFLVVLVQFGLGGCRSFCMFSIRIISSRSSFSEIKVIYSSGCLL